MMNEFARLVKHRMYGQPMGVPVGLTVMNRETVEYQIYRLTGDFPETVRDPLWKDIPLSKGLKDLFTSTAMQKLSRIKQLGPAHLLYPGAVHTRLDHSLGVCNAMRLIIRSLLCGKTPVKLTHEQIQAALAAAMLHDLGHFPYAHALKDMVSRDHEALGAEMITRDPALCTIIEEEMETSVQSVCSIIDHTIPSTDQGILLFRGILSGTLDPDKLDYLSRDALFCGIPYGMQDASYIIRNLSVTDQHTLAMPFEAIGAVEHLLFAKYSMYRNVYWHHVTRGATAMIKKAVSLGLSEGLFKEEDLYDLDDETFARLFEHFAGSKPSELFQAVRENRLLQCKASHSFTGETGRMSLLEDQGHREELEAAIHRDLKRFHPQLQQHEVLVDIPEQVSFESDMPILLDDGSHRPFSEIDELFNPQVVAAFVSSLRKIRLYVPRHIPVDIANSSLKGNIATYG